MPNSATKRAHEKPIVKRVVILKPHVIDRERIFVNPPAIHIGYGDSPTIIRWENQTGDLVKIWLPNADDYLIRPPDIDFSKPFDVTAEKPLVLTVKEEPKPKKNIYPYHVYCAKINSFAEGNSSPVVHCP
jgi:hypothetical protein